MSIYEIRSLPAPAGSASEPSIAFLGDPNTGIYSPGADQVAISTNSSQRLLIDASGNVNIDSNTLYVDATNKRVGLGTSSVSTTLDIHGTPAATTGGIIRIRDTQTTTGTAGKGGIHFSSSPGIDFYIAKDYDPALTPTVGLNFGNASTGASLMRLTANGLGIGTTGPVAPVHIEKAIVSNDTQTGAVILARGSMLGSSLFHQYSTAVTGEAFGLSVHGGTTLTDTSYTKYLVSQNGTHIWYGPTTATERARIDSSGRLLVGTSSARTVESTPGTAGVPKLQIEGNDGASSQVLITDTRLDGRNPSLAFAKTRNGAIVAANDILGSVSFFGDDGTDTRTWGGRITCEVDGTPGANDMPGRLVFSTTADGASSPTEWMRITSTGQVRLAGAGITFNGDTAAANELDDYEEGTWTPAYNTSNGDISITSTTVAHAVYTKIGNRVFCTCRFFSNVASVGTGTVRVTGLPFTTASTQADVSCAVSFAARFSTAAPVTATARASSTALDLITVYTDTTVGGNVTYMPAANLRTGGTLNILSISFNYAV